MRRRLAENGLKPWRKDMWCIPLVDGEYVARMEDVLDLYAEEPDPKRPVVCFDESPTQLIGEVRQPIPPAPGRLERYDCEYKRNGTANLFIFLDVHRPWRKVKVTERRAAEDYAQCMRELVDIHYPDAEYIRVVQDNLSTHSAGALYRAFPPAEARRILRRLEFHYTPKHASWLNMVENRDRSAAQPKPRQTHRHKRAARIRDRCLGCQRNASGARIKWMFTTDKRAPKWAGPTQRPLRSARVKPKSHNHCAAVLVRATKSQSSRRNVLDVDADAVPAQRVRRVDRGDGQLDQAHDRQDGDGEPGVSARGRA